MMKKGGQIAIFVILAIVVIAGIGFYFFVVKPGNLKTTEGKSEIPAYSYAEECIQIAIQNSVEIFGLQQGYYIVPEKNSFETSFYRIAYYYLKGEILIPDNDFLEKELGKIINNKIKEECYDFSFFEEEGYEINLDTERIDSETRISEDKVEIDINYPVFIRTNESSTSFSEFPYEIPIRIGHVIDVSKSLVEKIKENPDETDLTFLLNQDVGISILDFDECNKIYVLVDEQSKVNEEPFAFSFAVGFEERYCSGGNSNETG